MKIGFYSINKALIVRYPEKDLDDFYVPVEEVLTLLKEISSRLECYGGAEDTRNAINVTLERYKTTKP